MSSNNIKKRLTTVRRRTTPSVMNLTLEYCYKDVRRISPRRLSGSILPPEMTSTVFLGENSSCSIAPRTTAEEGSQITCSFSTNIFRPNRIFSSVTSTMRSTYLRTPSIVWVPGIFETMASATEGFSGVGANTSR